jgi:hypothetical protein
MKRGQKFQERKSASCIKGKHAPGQCLMSMCICPCHQTAEIQRKQGLRTQPKPGDPGYREVTK